MDRLIALVALRWRLELRALLRARERLLGLALLLPFLALSGLFGFLLAWLGVRSLDAARADLTLPLLSAAATGIGVFSALSPLLTGLGAGDDHDVTRLMHFPVPVGVLTAAALVSTALQPLALLRLPVLAGVALGVSAQPARLPLALLCVGLALLFMLGVAQATALALHALSRDRRLQDAALALGLVLGFLLSVAPLVVIAAGGRALDALARLVVGHDVFVLSPFAWGVRAATHAGRGEWSACLAFAALQALAIVAAASASGWLIGRTFRGELALGSPVGAGAPAARMRFEGALGALVEKDLRSVWRDPALKATLVSGLLAPLLFLFVISRSGPAGGSGSAVLLLASFVGLSGLGSNAFGLERRGVQLLLGFPVPRWRILAAKNLVALALRIPSLLTLLLAGVLLSPPSLWPAALTIALVTLAIAAGLDNFMAILFPLPHPAPGANPYGGGSASGRGLPAALFGLLLMLATLAGSAPFSLLAWLPLMLGVPRLWALSLPLALAGAGAVYALLLAAAESVLARREPELLQRILEEA